MIDRDPALGTGPSQHVPSMTQNKDSRQTHPRPPEAATQSALLADQAIWSAHAALAAGYPEKCLEALQGAANADNPMTASLEAVSLGLRAEARSYALVAAEQFERAYQAGTPLSAVLRECGHHFKRLQQYSRAYECFTLLECMQPGAIFEYWHELPPDLICRHAPWTVSRMIRSSPPRIYPLQPIKAAMVEAYGDVGAAMVLSPMLRPGEPWRLLRLPLAGLQDYARVHALVYRELIAPINVLMSSPQVHGARQLPGIAGRSRSVFLSVLPDIVVSSKSNLLLARDCVLMDYQGDEISRVDINKDADPIVLAETDNILNILDQAENSRRPLLEQAFCLVGLHSWNYGHWIFEFLFQVWACMDQPGFNHVPLVIDEQMPPQLRQALEFFVGTDHPIVVLKPGESVRVRELWTCSKIAYWPGGHRPGSHASPEAELSDTKALAELVTRLSPKLQAVEPQPGQSRRIYLRRKVGQKRHVVNYREVENWFVERGFELLDFDELSFIEQVRRIRGADHVIGPDGASFYGLLFARPGTRIGMLSQPFVEGYEWWNQMCTDLGHHVLLLPGELHELNPAYRTQSDIRVDVGLLPGFLEQLEQMPGQLACARSSIAPVQVVPVDHGPVRAIPAGRHEVIESATCMLWQAYQHLTRGAPQKAIELLEASPHADGRVGRAIGLVALGAEARIRDDRDTMHRCFHEAFDLGVPLPVLLRDCGRYFLNDVNDFARAYECFTLLDQLQPGAIIECWHGLPPAWKGRYAPVTVSRMIELQRPLFYLLQVTKNALATEYGDFGAAMVLAECMCPTAPWRLLRLPLASLQDFARNSALAYEVLIPSKDVHMSPPPVFGRPQLPGFAGRSRTVFLSVLPDVTVFSKSNLLLTKDCVLLDYQGDELSRISLNLDVNPQIVAADNGILSIIEPGLPARKPDMPCALALTGLHTWNYGHWVFEYMFQLWACLDRPGFDSVPIIIDAQMPPQLRELLEFFAGPGHPIVVLDAGASVCVLQLWTCSKIAYWPGGESLSETPGHDYELSDTMALAIMVQGLESRLDTLDCVGYPEKIYLTRAREQGRALVNRGEVEAMFLDRGFAIIDFSKLAMKEQLRHLRAARTVVLEAGSSIFGGLFCRTGAVIGEISSDDATGYEWCAEMFKALGHRLLLFPCEMAGDASSNPQGKFDKRVDLEKLKDYIDRLQQIGAEGSIDTHSEHVSTPPVRG